ncbi:hypothetical protein ABIF74_011829 [Bradyrhizobium japonicum]
MQRFRRSFRQLPDPRAGNARHDLLEVLFIALAAVVCGAGSCAEMEEFGRSKEGLLRLFLGLEHGIPSHERSVISLGSGCTQEGRFGLE